MGHVLTDPAAGNLEAYLRTTLYLLGHDPDEPQPRRRLQVIAAAWSTEVLDQSATWRRCGERGYALPKVVARRIGQSETGRDGYVQV